MGKSKLTFVIDYVPLIFILDMLKMGILDPTKVTRSALQNAASIAGLMITTECMVTELAKEDDNAPAAPAMPDMGGMGGMGMGM